MLTAELSGGATLVFSGCEEVHPPLRELCVSLEMLFHRRVVANLYAGWRRDNGFDIHFDTQDVIILQVSGRKRWKVWGPTLTYPIEKYVPNRSCGPAPVSEPLWDCVLEPGGMLHILRS